MQYLLSAFNVGHDLQRHNEQSSKTTSFRINNRIVEYIMICAIQFDDIKGVFNDI